MAEEHKEHGAEGTHAEGGGHGGGGHGGGGHGGGHEEAHEGAPEWLISFADNVALMMGFFVILLAMNMKKESAGGVGGEAAMGGSPDERMVDFVIAVRESFNNPISVDSKDPREQTFVKRILEKKNGEANMEGPKGRHNQMQSQENGTIVRPTATIPFEDGSAILTSEAREVAADVARRLKDQRWIIEVRGHVSPYEAMRSPQRARQLSFERAMAVGNAMADAGTPWNSMRISEMGDAARLVRRARDRESDRTNQRVEVIVTNEVVASDPYASPEDSEGSSTPAGG